MSLIQIRILLRSNRSFLILVVSEIQKYKNYYATFVSDILSATLCSAKLCWDTPLSCQKTRHPFGAALVHMWMILQNTIQRVHGDVKEICMWVILWSSNNISSTSVTVSSLMKVDGQPRRPSFKDSLPRQNSRCHFATVDLEQLSCP